MKLFYPSVKLLVALMALCAASVTSAAPSLVPTVPSIDARSYVLVDFDSGYTIAEEDADKRIEPASLTKLMTAYIVFHELEAGNIHLDDQVPISEKAWRTPGSRTFVEVGSKVTVEHLLKGMIVQSGNDATVALAEHVAGSEDAFVSLMNKYAASLDLANTHFANATGLPHPDHYSSARDLAKITRLIITEFPEYYKWFSIKEFTYNNISQYNRNKLLWHDDHVDGVKTGHTDSAGFCLVASAKDDDMRLIAVVIGTKSEDARAAEDQKLLNYGFRFFQTHRLYSADRPLTTVRVWKGETEQLPLGLKHDLYVTVPRGQYDNLNASMQIDSTITAPVQKGQQLGVVKVVLKDQSVAERPLVSLSTIPEGGMWQRLVDEVQMLFQ
jgi:D-alanyl-D-alanine carboxypeptidase (penicillin-binding protein 5/6)